MQEPKDKRTIEQEMKDTTLQQPQRLVVGGRTFTIGRPTTATLIQVSAAASQLPKVEKAENGCDLIQEVLSKAQYCTPLGDIIAMMIVGSHGAMHKGLLHRIWRRRVAKVSRYVLENATNKELETLAYTLLSMQDIGSFFGLIAFLAESNITAATKATAFGQ